MKKVQNSQEFVDRAVHQELEHLATIVNGDVPTFIAGLRQIISGPEYRANYHQLQRISRLVVSPEILSNDIPPTIEEDAFYSGSLLGLAAAKLSMGPKAYDEVYRNINMTHNLGQKSINDEVRKGSSVDTVTERRKLMASFILDKLVDGDENGILFDEEMNLIFDYAQQLVPDTIYPERDEEIRQMVIAGYGFVRGAIHRPDRIDPATGKKLNELEETPLVEFTSFDETANSVATETANNFFDIVGDIELDEKEERIYDLESLDETIARVVAEFEECLGVLDLPELNKRMRTRKLNELADHMREFLASLETLAVNDHVVLTGNTCLLIYGKLFSKGSIKMMSMGNNSRVTATVNGISLALVPADQAIQDFLHANDDSGTFVSKLDQRVLSVALELRDVTLTDEDHVIIKVAKSGETVAPLTYSYLNIKRRVVLDE